MARKKINKKSEAEKKPTETIQKVYRFYGLNTALELLRPNASWEWTSGTGITRWQDPRPQPTIQEIEDTMKKIKAFEDSINTIWTEEQLKEAQKITGPFI